MFSKIRFHQLLLLIIFLFTANLFAEKAEVLVSDEPTANENKTEKTLAITPVQFSFFAPLQILPERYDIYGVRLTLPYGLNKSLYGLDVGLVNKLGTLYGVGVSAFYSAHSENMYGINLAGVFNLSKGNNTGLSMAGFYNEAEIVDGIQVAALHNQAKTVNGIQISLFNYCHKMNGVQIGLLNYCRDQPFRYTLFLNFWDSANVEK